MGEKGAKGDRGEPGIPGGEGRAGKDGKNGKDGKDGKEGKAGKAGEKGLKGDKGDRGEKGEQGDSGLLSAKFPLVYDAQEKSVAIDEARLDKILNKIIGGKKLSPADTGWLASTGGGGKVEIFYNGTKITPDVRGINFIGSAVESVTKVGGKVTVKLIGGVSSVNGLTGDINLTIAGAGGKQYYLNPTTPSAVNGYRQLGETPYIDGGTSATATLTIANEWVLLKQFITDAGQPNQSFLPGGNWDVDLFSSSSAASNEVKFYMDVWLYNNTTGATTALGNSQNSPTFINEPSTTRSYNNSVYIQPRTLDTSDRIIVRLYAATTKNQTHYFTTYYEDSTISHIHTTFPAAVFPNYVSTFNGRTGDVQGVSAAVAGTGISVSGATGSVTITNTGVQSFNGLTGAVTGASLGANTFTGLNSFNGGISANGATLNSATVVGTLAVTRGITLNSTGAGNTFTAIYVERGGSADVGLRWNETTDRWQFSNDGTNWNNIIANSIVVNPIPIRDSAIVDSPLTELTAENDQPAVQINAFYNSAISPTRPPISDPRLS